MQPPLDPAALQAVRDQLPDAERAHFISELIDAFLADMEAQLAALRTAFGAGDVRVCGATAHRMRSGSGGIGAMRLLQLCAELEGVAGAGVLAPIGQYVAQIEAEYERVVQALEGERRQDVGALVSG